MSLMEYNKRHHSDLVLTVRIDTMEERVLTLHLHRVILIASPVFTMLLDKIPGTTRLNVYVDEESDLAALQLMLKCMYCTNSSNPLIYLPGDDADVTLLLRAFRLGDEYQLPDPCMAMLHSFLSNVDVSGFDYASIAELYSSVPASVFDNPRLADLQASSWGQRLVQLFGDVYNLISDQWDITIAPIGAINIWEEFCKLPYAAVLAWARRDDLKSSEDSVLYLMSCWINEKGGAAAYSRQYLTELACSIRVNNLSQFYLQFVMPNLKWISSGVSDYEKLLSLLQLRRGSTSASTSDPDGWEGPPAWMKPARVMQFGSTVKQDAEFELGAVEFDRLQQDESLSLPVAPDCIFYLVELKKHIVGDRCTLNVTLTQDNKQLECMGIDRNVCSGWPSIYTARVLMGGACVAKLDRTCYGPTGICDICQRSGATVRDIVEPLLDGEGHTTITIEMLNRKNWI